MSSWIDWLQEDSCDNIPEQKKEVIPDGRQIQIFDSKDHLHYYDRRWPSYEELFPEEYCDWCWIVWEATDSSLGHAYCEECYNTIIEKFAS